MKVRSRPRILVCEDDLSQRSGLAALLELEGYEVETAEDGVDGLAALTTFQPDLIIADLWMPRMNGLELARQVRESGGCPLILVSSHEVRGAKEAGASCCLSKPLDFSRLLDAAQVALGTT